MVSLFFFKSCVTFSDFHLWSLWCFRQLERPRSVQSVNLWTSHNNTDEAGGKRTRNKTTEPRSTTTGLDSAALPWKQKPVVGLTDRLDVCRRTTGTQSPAVTDKTTSHLHALAMLRLTATHLNSTARFSSFTGHRSPNVDAAFSALRCAALLIPCCYCHCHDDCPAIPGVTGIHEAMTSGASGKEHVCVCFLFSIPLNKARGRGWDASVFATGPKTTNSQLVLQFISKCLCHFNRQNSNIKYLTL